MQTGLDGITLLRDEATQNKPILALTTGSFAILKWRGTSTTERLGLANPLGRFRGFPNRFLSRVDYCSPILQFCEGMPGGVLRTVRHSLGGFSCLYI